MKQPDGDGRIGRLVEVKGDQVVFELTADPAVSLGEDYYPGQPGSHVRIRFGGRDIIAVVESVRLAENASDPGHPKQQAAALLLGTIPVAAMDERPTGSFERGVGIRPNAGKDVYMMEQSRLSLIFGKGTDRTFSFGNLANAPDCPAHVEFDRFFGRHVAVLGTTGSGKSCTVASILQTVTKTYPHPHIVVLDLHGEYAAAFPERSTLIGSDQIELPYWLLTFEEFADLCVDATEFTAHNQVMGLQRALRAEKERAAQEEKLSLPASLSVDTPIWFNLQRMVEQLQLWNTEMVAGARGEKQGPLYGVLTRLLMRLQTRLDDPRYNFLFRPNRYASSKSLSTLLTELLSVPGRSKLTILDLSAIPSDVIGVLASVVSRVVFEFNFWNQDHDRFPIFVVFEEAHNYVPQSSDKGDRPAKEAVERLAKEGRKYGIGIMVVSQRPHELSETVLSQCNTFVALRLSNPKDQDFVRRLVPETLAGLMDLLPSLRTGEALIVGDSVPMPTRIRVTMPDPEPHSADVKFAEWWNRGIPSLDVDRIVQRWRLRRRDI